MRLPVFGLRIVKKFNTTNRDKYQPNPEAFLIAA